MAAFDPLQTFAGARISQNRLADFLLGGSGAAQLIKTGVDLMKRRRFLVTIIAAVALLEGCASVPNLEPETFTSERISVETRGSGPDVVLIPGLSTSREVWAETIQAVPGYRYHLVDVAGFGGTDPRGNRAPGPLAGPLAEEVARYIREQRLVRPALVGHSLGGLMSLMIAARHPKLVDRAMVVDIPPFNGLNFGGPGATIESVRAMAPAARERYFGSDLAKSRQNTERLYRVFIQNDAARPAILKQALATDREVAGRIFEESFSLDLRGEVSAVRAPLTVLYAHAPNQPAANDRTDEIFQNSYRSAPRVKLKRINDSGHFIMLDQPDVFRAELRNFLRS